MQARSPAREQRRCAFWTIALLALSDAIAAPPYLGRPIQDVLQELQVQGVTFIYSTAVVPPDLTVDEEPAGASALAVAEQMLSPHGLELMRVTPGTYVVIKRRTEQAAAPRPAQRSTTDNIEEVVVSTSRYALTNEYSDAQVVLTQQQLSVLPRLGDETLRAVQRLPGAAGNGLSGLAAIRGGEPNETLILLDGMQLSEPFHLKNFFSPVSLLDSRMIAGMEVYSGGFAPKYGTRISAVIDATSLRPAADSYYELGASLFHTNALASQRFGRGDGQWLVSARRSNLREIADILDSDFGEPQYFDAFSRVEYALSPATTFAASYLGSRDKIRARRPSRSEFARAEYRNNYAWISLDHEWSSAASTRLIGSFTDVTNIRTGEVGQTGRRIGSVEDERFFHVAGLQFDGTYDAGRLRHRWGLSARQLTSRYEYGSAVQFAADYPFPGRPAMQTERSARLDPEGFEYAAHWSSRLQVTPRFAMELGVRWDDETYTRADSETQLAPRLSSIYELSDSQRLRVSLGRFFQSQAINEAQIEDGADMFFPAQRADQIVVGYEKEFAMGAQLRVEAYRKNYTRVRPRWENLFDPLVLVPELEYDRVLVDPDRARAEGLEIMLSKNVGVPWSWWFGYTWSQAKDVIDGTEVSRSWDQRHAITAGVHWANERWDLTLADTYHSGWPTTPVRMDAAGAVVVGARNSTRFDDFNSLDLRVSRRFRLARGELDAFLEISNLANERNPCCVEIGAARTPEGVTVLSREVNHWLGIVPSAGVLWRY